GGPATPAAPPAAGAGPGTPPAGSGTTTPPAGGGVECANGKDDDGDGQVDALGAASVLLFDPGCSGPTDTTENSEKTLPAQCGKGVVTQGSRVGFAVEIDGRDDAACPKQVTKGIVDLMPKIVGCDNSGWNDGHGDGVCSSQLGVWTIGGKGGDAWHGNGTVELSLCGTRAIAVTYTADGSAWERDMTVADPVGACIGPLPPANAPECGDGVDNDFDGQIDAAGVADSGPDPGCTSATDADESEDAFPATGCWPYVTASPDDASIAYIYLMPRTAQNSCPTMNEAVVSFRFLHVKSCAEGPYWDGAAAGSCTVKKGDAWISGGSGQRIAVALQLDDEVGCSNYVQGQIDMRSAGVWHEATTETAILAGDHLEECPSPW
ncbi:MAG TPA: hypothetical protein VNT03_04970, partial [Baekduia sp.]|nr:hypothetical protein [Baekduia sp.]